MDETTSAGFVMILPASVEFADEVQGYDLCIGKMLETNVAWPDMEVKLELNPVTGQHNEVTYFNEPYETAVVEVLMFNDRTGERDLRLVELPLRQCLTLEDAFGEHFQGLRRDQLARIPQFHLSESEFGQGN
jgi:hypothetical protein